MQRTDLTQQQFTDLARIIGHSLSREEKTHYNAFHSDEAGYFLMDRRPRNNRKLLLLYMGCWSRGILHYVENYRPELLEIYWPIVLVDYAFVLHCIRDKAFPEPEIVRAAWSKADAIIYSPVGSTYANFSSEALLKIAKPEAKTVAFSIAHQGCWWPICPFVGEEGAYAQFALGKTPAQVFDEFQAGTFEPRFAERYAHQMGFSKGRQSFGSIPLSEFVERHYLTHKLFFTYNHPTYNVQAFCAEACFGCLGEKQMSDEHCLALPPDAFTVGDIYPETQYEWDYYKFQYPMRWTSTFGGRDKFYRETIEEAWKRWCESETMKRGTAGLKIT